MAADKTLKYRVSLDFPPGVEDLLNEIQALNSMLSSRTETFKRALFVYRALVQIQADGEQIRVVGKDGAERQLVVL